MEVAAIDCAEVPARVPGAARVGGVARGELEVGAGGVRPGGGDGDRFGEEWKGAGPEFGDHPAADRRVGQDREEIVCCPRGEVSAPIQVVAEFPRELGELGFEQIEPGQSIDRDHGVNEAIAGDGSVEVVTDGGKQRPGTAVRDQHNRLSRVGDRDGPDDRIDVLPPEGCVCPVGIDQFRHDDVEPTLAKLSRHQRPGERSNERAVDENEGRVCHGGYFSGRFWGVLLFRRWLPHGNSEATARWIQIDVVLITYLT